MPKLKRIDTRLSAGRANKRKSKQKKHYRPTGVAIVTRGKWVLLVQSNTSCTWGPVKGGLEIQDANCLISTVLRELHEEVGLNGHDFELIRYLGSATCDKSSSGKKSSRHQVGKHFHCVHCVLREGVTAKRKDKKEIRALRWIQSTKELESLPMLPERRAIWQEAFKLIGAKGAHK